MVEVTGNLWTYPADWRIVTTNGTVKKNGECVMGRGCASEAKAKYPGIAKELGTQISMYGNVAWFCHERKLATFPVKHRWYDHADLDLIKESVEQLLPHVFFHGENVYVMPRPGCGNGHLLWEKVRPLLVRLPDNVKVITFA